MKTSVASIIHKLESKVRTEGITLRFAVVAYKDHPDPKPVEFQDFTNSIDAVAYANKLYASGGYDEPEAAHDGLLAACKQLNWMEIPGTPVLRYIFHVLDAPPHGKEFGNTN